MDLVLGIDLGTSYFKLGLFDRDGRMRGLARVAVPTRKNDTRHELPIDDFQHILKQAFADACNQAAAQPSDVKAVSYASQANTFLLLDQNLLPITPLILWTDGRARPPAEPFQKLFTRDDFSAVTGLGMIAPEFAAAKLLWFRQNQPEIFRRTHAVMTLSDYLVYLLTGRRTGDAATAALLGLWDLKNARWWDKAFEILNIPRSWFSTMLRPGTPVGRTLSHAADWLGLTPGTPLVAGSLDHHAAAIGAGIGRHADMSLSLGTVTACLHVQPNFTARPDCCTGPDVKPDCFFQLGFLSAGAADLENYRNEHAPNLSIEQLLHDAANILPGANGLRFSHQHGFAESPRLHAGGSFTPAHYARAILESTAFAARRLIENILSTPIPPRLLATGGGARSPLWLQIIADVLGCEVLAPDAEEPACRGAAILAAPAAGWFDSLDTARETFCSIPRRFTPDPAARAFYQHWLTKQNNL
jgi:xylulokinase